MLSQEELLQQRSRALEGERAMTEQQVQAQLAAVPGWSAVGDSIVKTYGFGNYYETLAFVNALAFVVHAEDHHPDLHVSYNRCEVRFNTHSVKGISLNDFICAAKADALYAQCAGS